MHADGPGVDAIHKPAACISPDLDWPVSTESMLGFMPVHAVDDVATGTCDVGCKRYWIDDLLVERNL